MPNKTERLETLRRNIDRLDSELLSVLSKRMEVVREVGNLKKEEGLPVLQEQRYTELRISFIEKARKAGLDEDFAAHLIEAIHEASVKIQKEIVSRS